MFLPAVLVLLLRLRLNLYQFPADVFRFLASEFTFQRPQPGIFGLCERPVYGGLLRFMLLLRLVSKMTTYKVYPRNGTV